MYRVYQVKKGDTIKSIAEQYNIDESELIKITHKR